MTRDEIEKVKAAMTLRVETGKVALCVLGIVALLLFLFGLWVSWRVAATLLSLGAIVVLLCIAAKRSEKVAELRKKLGLS